MEHNFEITDAALEQIRFIYENDFTASGKYFRIKIDGKGCDGFTYAIFLTHLLSDDVEFNRDNIPFIMDPFTAKYLKNITIDYKIDLKNNIEGFVVTNKDEKQYRGKFWV